MTIQPNTTKAGRAVAGRTTPGSKSKPNLQRDKRHLAVLAEARALLAPLSPKALRALAAPALAHQQDCEDQAAAVLRMYWGNVDNAHVMDLKAMDDWLDTNEPLSRWFLVHLIQQAGEKALRLGYSQHKAEIARNKNATARAWVQKQWADRSDKLQSKEQFALQVRHQLKREFDLDITPGTIAHAWLPKNKK